MRAVQLFILDKLAQIDNDDYQAELFDEPSASPRVVITRREDLVRPLYSQDLALDGIAVPAFSTSEVGETILTTLHIGMDHRLHDASSSINGWETAQFELTDPNIWDGLLGVIDQVAKYLKPCRRSNQLS